MRVGFLLLLALSGPVAFGRVGDSPDELAQRLGSPSALILDGNGYGLGVYRTEGFKEIRVTFVARKSQYEKYLVTDEQAPRSAVIATLRRENPDEDVFDNSSLGIFVGHDEPENELKFVKHSGEQRHYAGVLELKKWDKQSRAVVRSDEAVVEIPFTADDPGFRRLQEGMATITMLDAGPAHLDAPSGFVGRREDVDWNDAFADAHSKMQTLVRIESGEEVLFDRAVCGVHQTHMQLSNVPVAYGLLLTSKAERYCRDRFPHAKAFARGGCVVADDSPKFVKVYLCPQCVTACEEYAASQGAVDTE